MFFTRVLKWLTIIGVFVGSYITLPQLWINLGGGQTWKLDQDLPQWALGLAVVVVLLLVLKVVTHVVTKLLMWAVLVALIIIILSYFNVPVIPWLQGIIKFNY
jgi:hypothetical protein